MVDQLTPNMNLKRAFRKFASLLLSALLPLNGLLPATADAACNSFMARAASLRLESVESNGSVLLVDSAQQFAYIALNTIGMPRILKIRISNNTFERVAALNLEQTDGSINCGFLDEASGYAYFGLGRQNPGGVLRVRLSDMTRDNLLDIPNIGTINTVAHDRQTGHAYFGSTGLPASLSKVRLSPFSLVQTIGLTGHNSIGSVTVDAANQTAYLGMMSNNRGMVLKVDLQNFSEDNYQILDTGLEGLHAAAFDAGRQAIYYGVNSSPSKIIKVNLREFNVERTLSLSGAFAERTYTSAVVDAVRNSAYFSSAGAPGRVIRVDLSASQFAEGLVLNAGEDSLASTGLDVPNGLIYILSRTVPTRLIRVQGAPHPLNYVNNWTSELGEPNVKLAFIDTRPGQGYAYFASDPNVAPVTGKANALVKVRLSDFTRVGALRLSADDGNIESALPDTANDHAYLGMSNGKIVKVRLSDLSRAAVSTPPAEDAVELACAILDPVSRIAFFGANTAPGRIIRLHLDRFEREQPVVMPAGQRMDYFTVAAAETANRTGYFGSRLGNGLMVKLNLETSAVADTEAFNISDGNYQWAVMDSARGQLYIGGGNNVARLRLSDFTFLPAFRLPLQINTVRTAFLDPENCYLYTPWATGQIGRIALGDAWTVDGLLGPSAPADDLHSASVVDAANRFAYLATSASGRAKIVKLDIRATDQAVGFPPYIALQSGFPRLSVQQQATVSVTAIGSDMSYRWQKNGADIPGATGSSYTIPPVTLQDDGANFQCFVSNRFGTASSSVLRLTVIPNGPPSITQQPANATAIEGQTTATFRVQAVGTLPLNYQWQKNEVNIAGARSESYTTGSPVSLNGDRFRCVVTNADGEATSSTAVLTILPRGSPNFVSHPRSLTVVSGRSVQFFALANGDAPLSYQWQVNQTDIPGATDTVYRLSETGISDNGKRIRCRVSNGVYPSGVYSNEAVLTVTESGPMPAIIRQPISQVINVGRLATFSVEAAGTPPLQYQWQRNGVNIPGATTPSHTTGAVSLTDSGAVYRVRVSNGFGSITSNPATLTVTPEGGPHLTTHPTDQTVRLTERAIFRVTATGNAPISYQWQKNNVDIPGATAAAYVAPPAEAPDHGAAFRCRVSNSVVPDGVYSSTGRLLISEFPNPGPLPAPAVSDIRVRRNLLSPSEGHLTMDFENVPSGTRVLIYNAAGDLVKEEKSGDSTTYRWDGRSSDGDAPSGIYTLVFDRPGASQTIKKGGLVR